MPTSSLSTRIERIANALRKQKGNAWGGFTHVPDDPRVLQSAHSEEKIKHEEDEGWDLIGSVDKFQK